MILVVSGLELVTSYQNALSALESEAQLTSYLVSEWVNTALSTPRHILHDLTTGVDPTELVYPALDADQHALQTERIIRQAKLYDSALFLGLFNQDCIVTHTSIGFNLGFDLKDREYCDLVFQDPIADYKVSNMFISVENKMNITISYPVLTEAGDIAGFGLIGLNLSLFQEWLNRLEIRPGMVVSIFDLKRQLLARVPELASGLGQVVSDPTSDAMVLPNAPTAMILRGYSPLDGEHRVWSFRRVGNLPFLMVVGISTQEVLREWWLKCLVYVLGNGGLILFTGLGLREFYRSQKMAKQMEKLATIDPLTGLMNRRKFIEVINLSLEESNRYRYFLSVMLIDLDHFKAINDNYGHDVGDDVLKQFAEILRHAARVTDAIARWGGEEFIVMLPFTQEQEAVRFGARLQQILLTTPVVDDIYITVSMGVSQHRRYESITDVIKRADIALYHAKENGRNRVECSP
jgi:diguanylate cyclase (GGDEF)-like protein